MLPPQHVSRRGQGRRGETRRVRFRALGIERLEGRTLLSGGVIITVAGNGTFGPSGNGVPATQAQLDDPDEVALDAAGDLFIADSQNDEIREVVESNSAATALGVQIGDILTVAGDGTPGYKGDGGPATAAELDDPEGVAVDASGDIFIADSFDNVIREVVESGSAAAARDVSAGDIVTVAGTNYGHFTGGYSGDGGPATSAELDYPSNVALDASGDLFIADLYSNEIREVVESNSAAAALGVHIGDIVTVAGDGIDSYGGDGGPANQAYLSEPWDVALDAAGDLYIADSDNSVIREVVPAPVATKTAVFSSENPSNVGDTVTFTATVPPQTGTGTPTGEVTFTIDGTAEPPVQLQVVDGVEEASLPISTLAAGAHSVSAMYDGSRAFAPSSGKLPTQTVNSVSAPPPHGRDLAA